MKLGRKIGGLLAIFFVLLANIDPALQVHYAVQLLVLLAGVVFWLPAYSIGTVRISPSILLVLLLAFAIRWIDLAEAIPRHVDEIHAVTGIVDLWDAPTTPVLLPYEGVPAFTRIYTVLQMGTVEMLGANLAGLRYVSVLFGVLTVAATYAMGIRLFNRRVALMGALMLAIFPPHIHFSRLGLNNVVDPFFGTLALVVMLRVSTPYPPSPSPFIGEGESFFRRWYFQIRAKLPLQLLVSQGEPSVCSYETNEGQPDMARHVPTDHYYWAGMLLGMTAYFYEGGRLLFPALILMLMLVQRRLAGWRVLIGYVLIAAPVYIVLLVNGLPFAPRLDATLDTSLHPLENLLNILRFLFLEPETSWFYAGDTPLILHWMLPFVLMGGWLAWRRGVWILLVWILLAIGGNMLLYEVQSPRYVVMFPALALIMGLGVEWLLVQIKRVNYAVVLQGIILVLIVWGQVGYYFEAHVPRYIEQFPEQIILDDIRFRSADLPDNTHIQVISNYIVFDSDFYYYLRFVGRHDDGVFTEFYPPADARAEYFINTNGFRNLAIFISPDDLITANLIHQTFPNIEAQFGKVRGGYLLFVIPRGQTPQG